MKERPIIFSAPEVRAILEGRKTQTRRAIKPQPDDDARVMIGEIGSSYGVAYFGRQRGGHAVRVPCPFGAPGDRLWARETWQHVDGGPVRDAAGAVMDSIDDEIIYRASRPNFPGPWRSPIHMPQWASRITLEITNILVERLHAISEDDARAEGCRQITEDCDAKGCWHAPGSPDYLYGWDARGAFRRLWEHTNGPGSWEANPWVWCIEFRRVTA